MKKDMRELTDRESEHVARLIRRGGEVALAALLGSTDGTIRAWQSRSRWPVTMIEKVMLLTLDSIPKKLKAPRPKPPKAARLMSPLTRSELLYYINREE
jgi:hypothetical protein